jgi:choloylglycine hydrolase
MKKLLFLALSLISINALACTGMQLKAKDNSFVNGRTIEFGTSLNLGGLIVPRNYEFKGTNPDGIAGLVYRAKYAAVGGGMFGEMAIADGLNEKGLSVGTFYFPGYAGYATVTPENKSHALSPTEFANWIITQFASVDEVKNNLKTVVIVPTTPKGWPVLPPFHYVVYDKTGKSITIEPVNGQLQVYDNLIGVLTNSPDFNWHLTNLANYINLTPNGAPPVSVNGLNLQAFGQGSGLHGLPGDFSPPSRFVRAAVFSSAALPSDNADQAVFQLFHILNQFDIPVGAVRTVAEGKVDTDSTLATTVKDSQNLKYYFRTYDDQTIKVVDLQKFDLNAKKIKVFSMAGSQPVTNISASIK